MARTRIGRSALALTLALLAALAAIGVLAWFVARGRSTRELERADNAKVAVPADIHADVAAETTPVEARRGEKGEAGSGAAAAGPSSTGGGTLRIRVIDERTLEPVSGVGFLAYVELGALVELGRGRTDAQGRAELRDVEHDTFLVRIERTPPHAEQTRAVWVARGTTKEVEIRVGAGGAVVGRVVDDLEQPVAGATIRVAGCGDVPSGPDGRFRVEHLAARPNYQWLIGGSNGPPEFDTVQITVTDEIHSSLFPAMPVPGKDVDIGDLRLPRLTTYSGRLLDASGVPVAGAVLAPRPGLERGPAALDFQLRTGDVLTNGMGRFELRGESARPAVRVWTREGARQTLRLPEGQPGGRVDDVELWLKPETRFEFEFVDATGAPASIPGRMDISPGVGVPWKHQAFGRGEVDVRARTSDGELVWSACEFREADSKRCARLQIEPGRIREVEVQVDGYETVVEHAADGVPALVQRKLTLEPLPTIRVRLVCKAPQSLDERKAVQVQIQICMADPARHALAGGSCCGLGAWWSDLWSGSPLELVFPVNRRAAFWVYARAPRIEGRESSLTGIAYVGEMRPSGGLADVAFIGPFTPGSDVHEFALDQALFVRPSASRAGAAAPAEARYATLRARIIDARTGLAVKDAWIAVGKVNAGVDASGAVDGIRIEAGDSPVRVTARGYRPAELGERVRREGDLLDLGAIALEPLVRHHGRVLDANGATLPRVWLGIVSKGSPVAVENGGLTAEPDGSFDLFGDLDSSFVLQVVVPALHDGIGAETVRFALEPWPEDVVKEIRLPRCRKVVVTIAGGDPDGAPLVPQVCPAPGERTATCDHSKGRVPKHDGLGRGLPIASSPQGPRYVYLLAPGRHLFWGSNLMHELPPTELEVSAGDTDIELTIQAR